jgi:Na+/melibiose symporter-like transporter
MLLITVIPAAGSIITSLLFLFFYKLDTRMMNEIQTDLKANHYPLKEERYVEAPLRHYPG